MVARTLWVLLLSSVLLSCRSASVAGEFGPVRILLYAELREATHGWMGASPNATDMQSVSYSDSANYEALWAAMGEIIDANEAGQLRDDVPHKAVSAVVTGQRIKVPGEAALHIRSSTAIQIVDLPSGFYKVWEATMRAPPLE